MNSTRGDSEQTKADILAAAERLFAERGVLGVSVRDVAGAAGVTHGLVHHYFGSKDDLAAEVIRAALARSAQFLLDNPIDTSSASLDVMRRVLRYFLTEGKTAVLLLARAELSGLEPEKLALHGKGSSLKVMSERFAELQGKTLPQGGSVDPNLLAMSVGATIFGLVTMQPWLMAAVGLESGTFDDKVDDIIEIAVAFVGGAIGLFQQPCADPTPPASVG